MDAKITQATQGSRDLFSLLSVVVLFMYLHTHQPSAITLDLAWLKRARLTAMGKRGLLVRSTPASWRRVPSGLSRVEAVESDEDDAARDHGDGDWDGLVRE
jgi:hypothetical protein